MKKISLLVFAIMFAAAFGVAYAGEMSNGVTDFTGKTVDSPYDLQHADNSAMAGAVESSNAGGIRSADLGIERLNNGITDFSGRSYDAPSNAAAVAPDVVLGSFVKSAPRLPDVLDPGKPLTN